MPWGQIGAILAVLAIVFIIGHSWFRLVEGALGGLKRLFSRKKEPPVWHTLPPERDKEDEQHG